MQSTFQAGVDAIYNAIVGRGVTPTNKTPTALGTAIGIVAENKYTIGQITYNSVNVAVGQVWLICRVLGSGLKEGYQQSFYRK